MKTIPFNKKIAVSYTLLAWSRVCEEKISRDCHDINRPALTTASTPDV